MLSVRKRIGGLGNLMFKEAFIIGQLLDGNIPDQYVQSDSYWHDHAETIRNYFSEGIEPVNRVAIHIRRGDYKSSSNFHADLSETDYYQKAVALFPGEKFLVFCKDNQDAEEDLRDRKWCDDFLDEFGIDYEFAPILNQEWQDLNMMAGCKGIIMANSSFSWWAAFLSSGRIICPKRWFVDGVQRTQLLDEWEKI